MVFNSNTFGSSSEPDRERQELQQVSDVFHLNKWITSKRQAGYWF